MGTSPLAIEKLIDQIGINDPNLNKICTAILGVYQLARSLPTDLNVPFLAEITLGMGNQIIVDQLILGTDEPGREGRLIIKGGGTQSAYMKVDGNEDVETETVKRQVVQQLLTITQQLMCQGNAQLGHEATDTHDVYGDTTCHGGKLRGKRLDEYGGPKWQLDSTTGMGELRMLKLPPIPASEAEQNCLFVDFADGHLKFKDRFNHTHDLLA